MVVSCCFLLVLLDVLYFLLCFGWCLIYDHCCLSLIVCICLFLSDEVVLEVVEKGSAVGIGRERPARGVHDEPGMVPVRRDLPQLLQADAVDLRYS